MTPRDQRVPRPAPESKVALLVDLLSSPDPTGALIAGLDGHPDEVAAGLWSRLRYLEDVGLLNAFQAAGEAMAHPSLGAKARWWLLVLIGDHATRRVAA